LGLFDSSDYEFGFSGRATAARSRTVAVVPPIGVFSRISAWWILAGRETWDETEGDVGDGPDTRGAAGAGEPPSPRGVATLDELTGRLRELRAWAGNPSFSRLVRDIAALRAARGLPVRERSPGRVTVFECFRPGRRRVDVELLVDIAAVLGVSGPGLAEWRRAHRIASSAGPTPDSVTDRFPQGWPGSQARAVARLVAAVRAAGPGHVVNLTGPVGIGKSTVLARMAVDTVRVDLASEDGAGDLAAALGEDEHRLVVVDHVDSVAALAALSRSFGLVDRLVDRRAPVVVASRRALPARAQVPGELIARTVVVPVEAWSDEEIGDLAGRCGVGADDQRAAITRWAGGIPLLAEHLCRAVHRGVPVDLPGPPADLAAAEVWRRLRDELPPEVEPPALRTLASYGQADQELLSDAEAAGLAELSLVDWAAEGLAVREPYRTLFDHAHRWRTPLAHGRSVVKAVAHNREVIASSPDVERQVRRAEQTPPCTIAWPTSTPVGQPLKRMRPALVSSSGSRRRAVSWSPSAAWTVTVSWPSRPRRASASSASSSQRTRTPAAPKTSSLTADSSRRPAVVVDAISGAGAFAESPTAPSASTVTPAAARSAPVPLSYAWAMPEVSMVCPVAAETARAAAVTKASPSGPDGTKVSPGLVQNWPEPSVSEPT
jgi:hypothetical protein